MQELRILSDDEWTTLRVVNTRMDTERDPWTAVEVVRG